MNKFKGLVYQENFVILIINLKTGMSLTGFASGEKSSLRFWFHALLH